MTPKRVVIVGGGFGGVQCARTLRRRLTPEACEIVLFNRENHMVFHPLLPEVAGASLNPVSIWRSGAATASGGKPALNFYSVEKGTLDVIRTNGIDGSEQLVAVIGPGDFFGEMALLEGRARSASVRARTEVEVTTLGAQVFSRISKTLAPLQQRTTSPWTRMPHVHEMLSHEHVSSFVEPAPYILHGENACSISSEVRRRPPRSTA